MYLFSTHNVRDDPPHPATIAHTLTIASHGASVVMWQEMGPYRAQLEATLPTWKHVLGGPETRLDTPISYDPKIFTLIESGDTKIQDGIAGDTFDKYMTWAVLRDNKSGQAIVFASAHYINDAFGGHPQWQSDWNGDQSIVESTIKGLQAKHHAAAVLGCDANYAGKPPIRFGQVRQSDVIYLVFVDAPNGAAFKLVGQAITRSTESDHLALLQISYITTPAQEPSMISGDDESSYQSGVTGADFEIFKASQNLYKDPTHDQHVADARARGSVIGHYHFLVPGNILGQAAYFVQAANPQSGDFLACDWETSGVTAADRDAFIREVQRLRPTHQVGLYCSLSWWNGTSDHFYGDFLWIAAYNGVKGFIINTALFDQWNDRPIDEDIARFNSKADLIAWSHAKEAKPLPPRPDAVLQAERNLVLEIKERTAADPDGRDARIAYNILRGVKNGSVPVTPKVPMDQHNKNAIAALKAGEAKYPGTDVWGYRMRLAVDALEGKR